MLPVLIRPVKMGVSEQLAGLQEDQLGHTLVQNKVFKSTTSLRAPENQQEETEIGHQQTHLDRQSQDQERGRI